MLQGTGGTSAGAKRSRQEMSPAEIALWLALKGRPGEFTFLKQHPSGRFIADFYCHPARLVVEVDGEAHGFGDRLQRDEGRDAWFAHRGLATLRGSARDILKDVDAASQPLGRIQE